MVSYELEEGKPAFDERGQQGWEFCGKDAFGRHVWKREAQPPGEHHSVEQLEAWLAECYKLSGADPDGNENWRLAPHAVHAVGELRKDHDKAIGV